MIYDQKVVLTIGEYSIIRERYYGFRCNALSTRWEVVKNVTDVYGKPAHMTVSRHYRLRDAKAKAQSRVAI
jgi:hypothetical protein